MKISSKDFRVREGGEVNLKKWPTTVKPVYKSKKQYEEFLREHVAQLSLQQQLLYASNRHAILLIFQAMDAAGKDGAIRHVTSGVNPQGFLRSMKPSILDSARPLTVSKSVSISSRLDRPSSGIKDRSSVAFSRSRQPCLPPAHGAVVWYWEFEPHECHDGRQEPLRGPKAEVKDRFEDERTLDGSVRVHLWPARLIAARRVSPCGDRTLVEPERQLHSTDQSPIILGPVSNLVSEREFGLTHLPMLAVIRRIHFCNNVPLRQKYHQ
jgi:hypothetical protein